jgi:hypothetical protein
MTNTTAKDLVGFDMASIFEEMADPQWQPFPE